MADPDTSTAGAQSGAVLCARGLTRCYRMGEVEVRALRGVDLELYDGEFVVILGPSGSGKSTLLNLLGGLDLPTAGTLAYRGTMMDWSDAALTAYRRDRVGFVFQFYNLIPSLTARENVLLVTEISKAPMRAEDALGLVGLGDRMDHFPSQMSGGEQQRVAIARAIAKRPDLLLCDEPTGALDINTGRVVLEVLDRIHRELRTTTAIITHNSAIAGMADRVLTIGDGLVVRTETNSRRLTPSELAW